MFAIPGSRKGYYQWDINQRLYIQDSSCNEVHFCSEKHPEALTCTVQEELGKRYVQVPNILLQSCLSITAFFYVKGEADAYTKHSFHINVEERPKPDDYVHTETEVKTWESAVEYALHEAKESGAFKGEKGDTGDQGPQGEKGEKGEKGDGFLTDEDKLALSIRCAAEGKAMNLKGALGLPFAGLQIFGKTTQDLVSIGNDGSVEVAITGKNLLESNCYTNATNNYGHVLTAKDFRAIRKGEVYTISVELTAAEDTQAYWNPNSMVFNYDVIAVKSGSNRYTKTFTALADGELFVIGTALITKAGTGDMVGITAANAMVEHGSAATKYEAYEVRTMTVPTPDSLPGIPVSSGGNYTDENGQNWLGHIAGYEQDGQIGELKTTGFIESYAGEAIPGAYLSSTGGLGMGAAVRYALETPVFAPYDADTQEQWKATQVQKPNAAIYNDAGAWMSVDYAADTKTYIDNKFAELAAVIIKNT